MHTIIEARDKGHYPISIGTSLAIETLTQVAGTDPKRAIPKLPAPLESFGGIAINLNTLCMTLIGSMRTSALNLPIDDKTGSLLVEAVEYELDIIRSVLSGVTKIPITSYLCSYENLTRLDRRFHVLRVKTKKAGHYEKLLKKFIEVARRKQLGTLYKSYTDVRMLSLGLKVLVHTSYPYDIIGNERASLILEPHTGEILPRTLFYKKFYKVPKLDMSLIPLNKVTLLLFGDKHLIQPIDIKLRKEILKLALEQGWMYNTATNRVVGDILSTGSKELKTLTNTFRR